MKLSHRERAYLTQYNKNNRNSTDQSALDRAFDAENDLFSTRPTNSRRINEIVRKMVLSSEHAGLIIKETATDNEKLAIIVSTLEDMNTSTRKPFHRDFVQALVNSDIHFMSMACPEEGKDSDDFTYVAVLNIRPGSTDHEVLLAGAEQFNLDIRVTSRGWFDTLPLNQGT